MTWYAHATVAVVVERDGRFLLVEEQVNQHTVLNQPAGHIEPNETFVQAAIRETLEETGWQVKPAALLGIYAYSSPDNGITYHRTCFIAEAERHFPEQPLDEGIIAAKWMTPDEIMQRKAQLRSPMVIRCINDYLAGRAFPLDLITEMTIQEN